MLCAAGDAAGVVSTCPELPPRPQQGSQVILRGDDVEPAARAETSSPGAAETQRAAEQTRAETGATTVLV